MSQQKFPEGLKIQEIEGPGELKPLLSKLRRYTFNGYIKVEIKEQLEGYLTLKDGIPKNAVIYTPADREIKGVEALEKIQGFDDLEDIHIEVRTNVDIDELISEVPGKLPLLEKQGYPEKEEIDIEGLMEGEEERKEIEEEKEEMKEKKVGEGGEGRGEERKGAVEEKKGGGETVEPEGKGEKREEERREEEEEGEEMKEIEEKEIEEKEIEIYDMAIRAQKGEKREEPGEFPEKYSFDNFIVGPNNKFAYEASKTVAKYPGHSFNPLFITSPSGLGKTHLLKAIGHYLSTNDPDLEIKYTTTARFSSELSKSIGGENTNPRDEYSNVDVVLFDDVQFLADRDEVQEEIFHIFNDIKNKGGQVVLSCDRPPEDIPSLEERLVSRFKSGLVVDIHHPTFKTRLGIVEMILEEHDVSVSNEIKNYIAKKVKKNVRELEGALNRILAFSSLLDQEITMDSVQETLEHRTEGRGAEETAGEAGREEEEEGEGEISIECLPGRSYLIEERRAERGFQALKQIGRGKDQIIFSRINPGRIRHDFDLTGAEIYWLTGKDSPDQKTVPPNLESLTWQIEERLENDSVILLDGLEYLISNSGFDATIQFVRHMIDTVSETGAVFLLSVSPGALQKRQLSILEREMEVISFAR